jgi:hypothetical protein
VVTPARVTTARRVRGAAVDEGPLVRWLGHAWPLKALLVGLPLWWALGLGVFGFLIAALAMGVQLYRWRPLRVPAGFGVWVLFLVWTLGTVTVLWARAPQTLGGGGVERLLPFALRGAWYVAITIAMLYPLNIPAAKVSNKQFVRWMALVFAYCILLGIVAMAFPRLEFTSVAERLLPGGQGSFLQSMTHPRLATTSGFLGYEQPRPSAPFLYANTWGNNVGLLLPFFVFAWMRIVSTWKKFVGAVVGLLAVLPIVYSLNRGLWLALGVLAVYVGVILARQRKFAILWAAAVLGVIALTGVAASPVGQTFTTRLETPHSNERRGDLATTTISVTATGSPVVGYGSTRKLAGSFSSVAGGRSVDCEKCDVPPLGTQGYLWYLILSTGFGGTLLFGSFLAIQFFRNARRMDPMGLLGCIALVLSGLFFFVYDSLESPMFFLMLAIGLLNRPVRHAADIKASLPAHLHHGHLEASTVR